MLSSKLHFGIIPLKRRGETQMIEPKEIIRTKRKSIALIVKSSGDLIVRAPRFVSNSEIMAFVLKKQKWIEKKCFAAKAFDKKYIPITMSDNDTVVFMGKTYNINISDIKKIAIYEDKLLIPANNNSKKNIIVWLKQRALMLLVERTEKYSKIMGVKPNKIKITEAKTRWGSCSQNNNLNFAWRLVMCPVSVIDYVVVHELGHIVYKNHGKDFWVRVKTVLPNYKEQQEWLKINRKLMEII